MKGVVVILTLFVQLQQILHISCWCYEPTGDDCSHWTGLCSAGRRQSPINITAVDRRAFPAPQKMSSSCKDFDPIKTFTVYNNGHAANIRLNLENGSPPPQLQVEFRQGIYILHNIHFHWGSTLEQGSEHAMRGRRFPMEMHWVHYNNKYKNVLDAGAVDDPYAILVLAVFIKLTENAEQVPSSFDSVIKNLQFIRKANTEHRVTNGKLKLCQMLPESFMTSKFFANTYEGSLTTPPCSETVEWVIAEDAIYLTKEQISEFHQLELDNVNKPGENDRNITTYHPVVYKRHLMLSDKLINSAAVNAVGLRSIFMALCLSKATLLLND